MAFNFNLSHRVSKWTKKSNCSFRDCRKLPIAGKFGTATFVWCWKAGQWSLECRLQKFSSRKKTNAFLHQHRLFVLGTLSNFSHIRWLETCIPARHEPMRPGHIRVTSTPCLQCVYWCSSFQKIFVFNSKTSRLVCGQANVVFFTSSLGRTRVCV